MVSTLFADVIVVKLHHEMLKHKPTKIRHVDIPPDSDHLRLDWLMLLTFSLRVSFVPKLIVVVAFLYFLIRHFPFVCTFFFLNVLYPFNWLLKAMYRNCCF